MPTITALYFAHVKAVTGCAREAWTLPDGATAADAVAAIVGRYPGLARLVPSLRVALDAEFVAGPEPLSEGAELVLIPPVSGGAGSAGAGAAEPRVALGPEPLDAARQQALERMVSGPEHGALVVFVGTVRDHARGHAVVALTYEAYVPMALKQMERMVSEVEAEAGAGTGGMGDTRIALHHRLGPLVVGDVAVIVAVGSAHRAAAFQACQRVIDRLKADVPIWKYETGPDGAEWVSDRP